MFEYINYFVHLKMIYIMYTTMPVILLWLYSSCLIAQILYEDLRSDLEVKVKSFKNLRKLHNWVNIIMYIYIYHFKLII